MNFFHNIQNIMMLFMLSREIHCEQMGVSHCLQWNSHCFVECSEHLGVDKNCFRDTTLWNVNVSERWLSKQVYKTNFTVEGRGREVLQRVQRTTSWPQYREAMTNHSTYLLVQEWSKKTKKNVTSCINDYWRNFDFIG